MGQYTPLDQVLIPVLAMGTNMMSSSHVLYRNSEGKGFGSMGFGSLGFLDRKVSDKVLKPRILDTLRAHHVSQISTGLYHTVVITSRGQIFGFGDNERTQLGHDTLTSCLEPTQIFIKHTSEDVEST
ncbi:hypothetical protein D0Y65_001187 [Glycine soja]|uniref:Ultraviolet-B receptor UVR8 n=1 Tax=Glycine soja TaxID=3848 RepID=A0A445M1L6_GLYSO|nr:hypothetical protein D0Y65_001187 [Glycine soja]